mmetsp:Transcript_11789/g.20154  ORF Transcript_11789/g.20154 Transcript_11789/m.20154 type:complete len:239 (+) Transcript_11789:204-920(+)
MCAGAMAGAVVRPGATGLAAVWFTHGRLLLRVWRDGCVTGGRGAAEFAAAKAACERRRAVQPPDRRARQSALHQRGDVGVNVAGREVTRVALDQLAVGADQELLEVPRDVRARDGRPQRDGGAAEAAARQDESLVVRDAVALRVLRLVDGDHDLALEPLEERESVGAVDVALLEESDGRGALEAVARADVLERVEELVVVLVGLVAKLVAREAENVELVAVLFGQDVHRTEVLDRRAS